MCVCEGSARGLGVMTALHWIVEGAVIKKGSKVETRIFMTTKQLRKAVTRF